MTNIIQKLSSGWHLARILRTALGLAAAVEAIRMHDWAIGLLGAILLYQGLTDIGCCSAAGCATAPTRNRQKTQDITYEEIK